MYRYQRRSLPLGRLLLAAAVVAAVGLAALVFNLPRLAGGAPQGGPVSARAAISLTFSTDMQTASVESRVHITPDVTGAFTWQDRTLRFTPGVDWPAGPVQVRLDPGASARSGLTMLFGDSWTFTVGDPAIAFLLRSGDTANLYSLPAEGTADPTAISQERFGIDRFAISPDGGRFVYAALRADGGADLKSQARGAEAAMLLDCGGDRCTAPAFSPDGARLAYERHPQGRFEQSTVEVLDLATQARSVLSTDASHLAQAPAFARDGRLAYLDLVDQVVVIHDFTSGSDRRIPDASGEMGAWSPDGAYLVFPQITSEPPPTPLPGTPAPALQLDTFFSHLARVDTTSGAASNLSGSGAVEDAAADFSPAGDVLVFGRKQLLQTTWTPGRQLWLMHADGSGARPLTNDPLFNHSSFAWAPDGGRLVYVRFDVTDPSSTPEIWIMGADGSGARKLVAGGFLPVWLP